MHLLTEEELAHLWRVPIAAPRLWWKLPFFDEQELDGLTYYSCRINDVDEYMRSVASGFGELPIPSIAELVGERGLLKSEEAGDTLDVTAGALLLLAHKGDIPAFRLAPSSYRYPAAILAQLIERQARECVDMKTVALVLGLSRETTRLLIPDHLQKAQKKLGGGKLEYVTRESYDALLHKLLPEHVSVEQWWEERLRNRTPMWSASKAGKAWHMDPVRVLPHLADRNLPYITSPSGIAQIPAWVAETIAEERRALTPAEIELIFGVSLQAATGWVQSHLLCKDNHGGGRGKKAACPSRLCVAKYMPSRLIGAPRPPEEWIRNTLKMNAKAIRVQTLFDVLHEMAWKDVMELAEGEVIQVLELPYGDHVITRADALVLRRLDQQRLRTMNGPDYHGEYT